MPYRHELPPATSPGGLIGRAVAAVGAAVLFVGAFFLGFVVLAVLIGIAALAGLALWLRLWWFGRQLRRAAERHGADGFAARSGRDGDVLEGEFIVVQERRRDADS